MKIWIYGRECRRRKGIVGNGMVGGRMSEEGRRMSDLIGEVNDGIST